MDCRRWPTRPFIWSGEWEAPTKAFSPLPTLPLIRCSLGLKQGLGWTGWRWASKLTCSYPTPWRWRVGWVKTLYICSCTTCTAATWGCWRSERSQPWQSCTALHPSLGRWSWKMGWRKGWGGFWTKRSAEDLSQWWRWISCWQGARWRSCC